MIIRTSYFYQVRFFKKNMLPLSTAVYDPKWFHNFCSQSFVFLDKNGIINGLRLRDLAPGPSCVGKCAGRLMCGSSPDKCDFYANYKNQLRNICFTDFMYKLERASNTYKNKMGLEEDPIVVLLVHEAPNNECSERKAIQDWFKENGVAVSELKYPIAENY